MYSQIFHEHNPIRCLTEKELYFCDECGSILIKQKNKYISTVKPLEYNIQTEIDPALLISIKKDEIPHYQNKKEYLNVRKNIVKELKKISSSHLLSLRTFFLSIIYLDIICSKMSRFDYDHIKIMSIFCLIISAKFSENGQLAYLLENEFKSKISPNYHSDEIYVLSLLNYDLNKLSCYDIINQCLQNGFLFENENINFKKMNFLYKKIETMLYAFVESNSFISLSQNQIAVGLLAFIRENLNLEPFSQNFNAIFNICQEKDLYYYNLSLNKMKSCLKISKNENKKINNISNNNQSIKKIEAKNTNNGRDSLKSTSSTSSSSSSNSSFNQAETPINSNTVLLDSNLLD